MVTYLCPGSAALVDHVVQLVHQPEWLRITHFWHHHWCIVCCKERRQTSSFGWTFALNSSSVNMKLLFCDSHQSKLLSQSDETGEEELQIKSGCFLSSSKQLPSLTLTGIRPHYLFPQRCCIIKSSISACTEKTTVGRDRERKECDKRKMPGGRTDRCLRIEEKGEEQKLVKESGEKKGDRMNDRRNCVKEWKSRKVRTGDGWCKKQGFVGKGRAEEKCWNRLWERSISCPKGKERDRSNPHGINRRRHSCFTATVRLQV